MLNVLVLPVNTEAGRTNLQVARLWSNVTEAGEATVTTGNNAFETDTTARPQSLGTLPRSAPW